VILFPAILQASKNEHFIGFIVCILFAGIILLHHHNEQLNSSDETTTG